MKKSPALPALIVASLFVCACGGTKDAPAPTPTPTPTPAPAPAPAPTPTPDAFAQGYCEVTVDGEAPRKTPGGASNVSTMYWAGPMTRNPSWPLLVNCGNINLSGNGDASSFPMGPAKYPILKVEKDGVGHFTILSPLVFESGEVDIQSWDMLGLKGTSELKAKKKLEDPAPVTVKGVFDFKCPYTRPGEPCLSKPTSGP